MNPGFVFPIIFVIALMRWGGTKCAHIPLKKFHVKGILNFIPRCCPQSPPKNAGSIPHLLGKLQPTSLLDISLFFCYRLYSMSSFAGEDMLIDLGKWTEAELDKIMREASQIEDAGLRIEFISGFFIGLEYKESTLLGNISTAEVFVINFSGVDCFTFIDYIEAMRLSDSFECFISNLKQVRYLNGILSFKCRKHFFTDWAEYAPSSVDDLTEQIGGGKAKSVAKALNLKENGTPLLPGIESFHRTINYMPSEDTNSSVLQKLKTGDYAGIYSSMQGLDVSHVGIIIRDRDTFYLRHASSDRRFRKVVDQELQEYISGTPGLVILRPRDYRG